MSHRSRKYTVLYNSLFKEKHSFSTSVQWYMVYGSALNLFSLHAVINQVCICYQLVLAGMLLARFEFFIRWAGICYQPGWYHF